MKSVLPRLAEFGAEGSASDGDGRSHPHKRHCNRPLRPVQWGHEQPSEVSSPGTINLTCTSVREQELTVQTEEEEEQQRAQKVAAHKELKQLQTLWESQRHHVKLNAHLSDLTLVGQGTSGIKEDLTVLSVKDVGSNVPTDGNTEWTALSWRLPHHHCKPVQLACLLLCKGVIGAELPRMNIVDWKPGSLGIPTFHCQRCMNNWLRKGDLPKDCSEPENITEGPTMCITFSDQASSELMVVDGIVGEDGKPVKIKVKDLESIRKLLKRKAKERHKRKQRRARKKRKACKRPREGDNQKDGETEESSGENESESDCSGSSLEEELLNLPKLFQKYILKKAGRKHRQKRNGGRDSELASGGESSHGYSTSSFSSASSDSSDTSQLTSTDHDHHDKKHNKAIIQTQRRHRSKGNSQKEAASSSDEKGSTCSNENDLDSTCSSPHCPRRKKMKSKLSRQNKSKCSSEGHAQVSRVEDQGTSTKTGKWKNQSKLQNRNYHDETYIMPDIDGSRQSLVSHQNGQLTNDAGGIIDINDKTRYNSTNSGGFQLPNIADASSHSTVTRKQRRSIGDPLNLPQLSQASVQQRTQDQLTNDSHAQLHYRRQSTLYHDVTRRESADVTKGSKIVSNFVSISGSHFSTENATHDGQLSNPAQRRRGSQMNPNHASAPPGNSPQVNSTGLTKSADVTQGSKIVSNSVNTSGSHFSTENATHDGQLSNPAKQRRGSQMNPNYASAPPGNSPQVNSTGLTKSADVTKGSKIVSNSVNTSGSHFSTENATHDGQLSNPAQRCRGSQITSAPPGNSPQANSTGLTKIATVREDVHIAAGSQPKGRLKQARKKKKSQMAHEETPHIHSSAVDGEKTTHITLPLNAAAADKVHVDTQLELQKHRGPTSTDHSHAKRIGRKIIKKTRKSTDPQAQAPVNHNSEDLGYLMEKADVDAGFRLPKGSATYDRRNSVQTIYSNNEMCSNDSRMIPYFAKTSTTGLLSSRPGTARRTEHPNFMPLMGSCPNSTKFGDAELYSGLGTKFTRGTSAAYEKLPLAPVHKNQVEMPAKELEFIVGKTTVLPPITEANTGGDNSCLPSSTSQAPCQNSKVETDSGLEVSTEEECSDDEELPPVFELKPISALSFTSAYAYSFFSMAAQHRKVYNITRKKALEPVRLGRTRLLRKKN